MLRLSTIRDISSFVLGTSMVIVVISLMVLTIALMMIGFSTIAPEYRLAAVSLAGVTGGFVFAVVADWLLTR
jgi:hypothetical protein